MTPKAITAELRAIRDRIDTILADISSGSAFPSWHTDKLEDDGAWRPAWLVELNERARQHRPDGYINRGGDFRWTPMTLIHSVLWWPIYGREDLTQGQRETYEAMQRDHYGQWLPFAASDRPIMPLPRPSEDIEAPGGESRWAVLGPAPGQEGALPTEEALRECIERLYVTAGYLPSE